MSCFGSNFVVNIKHYNTMSKFNELINGDKPVLVDFYADWCGPCRILSPIIKEVKSEFGDQLKVVKIDVDRNPAASGAYGIQGVPTMILFKEGKILWRQAGVLSKQDLVEVIKTRVN